MATALQDTLSWSFDPSIPAVKHWYSSPFHHHCQNKTKKPCQFFSLELFYLPFLCVCYWDICEKCVCHNLKKNQCCGGQHYKPHTILCQVVNRYPLPHKYANACSERLMFCQNTLLFGWRNLLYDLHDLLRPEQTIPESSLWPWVSFLDWAKNAWNLAAFPVAHYKPSMLASNTKSRIHAGLPLSCRQPVSSLGHQGC